MKQDDFTKTEFEEGSSPVEQPDPDETASEAAGVSDPVETPDAGDAAGSVDASGPGEISDSGEPSDPGEASDPGEPSDPGEASDIDAGSDLDEASGPEESGPVETQDSVEASGPGERSGPEDTLEPYDFSGAEDPAELEEESVSSDDRNGEVSRTEETEETEEPFDREEESSYYEEDHYYDESSYYNEPYYDDEDFRDIPIRKKKRRKHHPFFDFLIAVAAVILLIVLLSSDLFAIRNIEVEGNHYYTDREVITMANAVTGRNLIFHPHASEIRKNLMKNPYFEDVKVRRKLPSTQVIEVTERKQVAAVVYGNKYIVIDGNGKILRIAESDPKVTLIEGLTLTRINEGQKIGVEQKHTLKTTLSMLKSMRKGDLYFKKIRVSNVFIKAYVYDNLVVKGSPSLMKQFIDEGKLQKVLTKLYSQKIKRGTLTIDNDNMISFSAKVDK
ncbi:MAG: FtsQ-type POTRA domain-containing protein [Anaerovoracaceae bacterium]|jgi:cell division protein FtsQ